MLDQNIISWEKTTVMLPSPTEGPLTPPEKRDVHISCSSHSISLTNKRLTLTFSPLSCWCKILSQTLSRSPSSVAPTSLGCDGSWVSPHSSVWGVHSSQHPLPPKTSFPNSYFLLCQILHCITFNDFLTSPLKQTRKPPSYPYSTSSHSSSPLMLFFPCPREYLHCYCQLNSI